MLQQVREVDSNASWRSSSSRLSHWDLMQRILENGQTVSPIFSVPWLTIAAFRIDWLHAADQGVTVSFLGNLFVLLRNKLPGPTIEARTQLLWELIQEY